MRRDTIGYSKEQSIGPKIIKVSKKKQFPKATGQAKVFAMIWNTRPHICEHCGIRLREYNGNPLASYFSHDRAKSIDSENLLNPRNITLMCEDCHDAYGARGRAAFEKRKNLHR